MRVPVSLSNDFGKPFEELIARFATERKLLPEAQALHSKRFLSRSVIPHIRKLSAMFNRIDDEQDDGLDPYWKESSNPANLRLAYFLYFMPSNLFRVASVWAELGRLGFKWSAGDSLRGIELGAGPAAGATGIAAGEKHARTGLPNAGNWALIEQDKAMLELGSEWAQEYFADCGVGDWGTRVFQRKIELAKGFLPPSAPRFNLWVMSYFLNEFTESPSKLARELVRAWDKHLEDESIIILIEPALRLQSRRLLELRRALLKERPEWLKLLLPCLGEQACGALAAEDDWCHEEVSWWRPPYFRQIDQMAGLDRKTLPFSYLVFAKSRRSREEILPALASYIDRQRLVSPSHREGKELEFFLCGQEGKRRARYRPSGEEDPAKALDRGDILLGAEIRGDVNASRVEKIKKVE